MHKKYFSSLSIAFLFIATLLITQLDASSSSTSEETDTITLSPFDKIEALNRGYFRNIDPIIVRHLDPITDSDPHSSLPSEATSKSTHKSRSKKTQKEDKKGKGKEKAKIIESALASSSIIVESSVAPHSNTIPVASSSNSSIVEISKTVGYQITFNLSFMAQASPPSRSSILSCLSSHDTQNYRGYALLKDVKDDTFRFLPFEVLESDAYVGRVTFEKLAPSSTYTLQLGYTSEQHPLATHPKDLNWSGLTNISLMTPCETPDTVSHFIYGSCNRIGHVAGVTLWQGKASRVLETIAEVIQQKNNTQLPVQAFMSIGDWVYLDATGAIGEADTFPKIVDHYHRTHGTTGARALFANGIPIYQVRDDHEFWNDSTAESQEQHPRLTADAQKAYNLFQRPQGPDTPTPWFTIKDRMEGFVMDLRSELYPSRHQAVSDIQMNALKSWLADPTREEQVKPVFMSTTALMFGGDAWSAAPGQLSELLNFILENNIKYVAFFTGDIHVGKTGLWRFERGKSGHIIERAPFILEDASSAFHKISTSKDKFLAPNKNLLDHGGPTLTAEGRFSPTVMEDHFTQVYIDHEKHTVLILKKDRKGALLMKTVFDLERGKFHTFKDQNPKYVFETSPFEE